ncbi:Alpha beta hydrolase fold protein [Seminavis robusta]|uniref:Alpha beta hydrolase fold protein n=1 Tax=Seminavis robusta TaxID=568900 RepID=A0A9N8DJU9_9STRA|nr:Alpha beta hydrolase fold protein [Seminavis robusta]|eukprot:Sro120_g058690.1 Alpha beta hydrolase fold protein (333) ;mRNA; r:101868-102866
MGRGFLITHIEAALLVLLHSHASLALASETPFRRGLVPTSLGLVHYQMIGDIQTAAASRLLPIVGFHMSPRSVDEYKEVMELSYQVDGNARIFVAIDEFGYGQSDNPTQSCSIDQMADCFLQVLTRLGIQRCIAAGSLMGCYIALSLAGRYPERIVGVVCSNLYYFQPAAREKAVCDARENTSSSQDGRAIAVVDPWTLKDDGSHIGEIWDKRSSWLSPELNTRATLDNLIYLVKRRERYAKGIYIPDGGAFPLPDACWQSFCPVLCINGAGAIEFFDKIGMDMTGQFQEAMTFFVSPPKQVVMEGSINMLNENPTEWLGHVVTLAKQIEGA